MNRMKRERRVLCQSATLNKVRELHAHPGLAGRKRKVDGTAVDQQAILLESVVEKALRSQVTIKILNNFSNNRLLLIIT